MTSAWLPDLIATYFPKLSELTEEQLQSARDRAEAFLRAGWPDTDLRPLSPMGDLALTPFAHLICACEVALGRFMSDLDMEQVANGVIFNCDFVTAFLKNFAIEDTAALHSSGVVRLVFNADKTYTIDRRTRFKFGENEFSLRLAFEGHMEVKPVGSVPALESNSLLLSDLGNGTFAVDVAVTGTMDAAVFANDAATLDLPITELVSATALIDFNAGSAESSLAALAKKTRDRFHAAALISRKSAVSYLQHEFPELLGVSAVVPGDAINMRASVNPLGISVAAVDLHVRSSSYDLAQRQLVRIQFVEQQEEVSVRKFIGKLSVVGNPVFIRRIVAFQNSDIVFYPGQTVDVYSRSSDAGKAPMLTAAGTPFEELWVAFDMVNVAGGASEALTTETDADGTRWAYFYVDYVYDPLYRAVFDQCSSPDVKPAGVDILVRPFVPVAITRFHIEYVKQAGKSVTLNAAHTEIFNYLRTLSSPEGFSAAKIGDAMFYAGAEDVRSIEVLGEVWWSAATKLLPSDADAPDVDYAAAVAAALNLPSYSVSNSFSLTLTDFADPEIGTADETLAAVGLLNSCLLLESSAITFSESLR